MSNIGKGFLVSLCLHLALFTTFIALARMADQEEVGIVVDVSFLGLSGSGSGSMGSGGSNTEEEGKGASGLKAEQKESPASEPLPDQQVPAAAAQPPPSAAESSVERQIASPPDNPVQESMSSIAEVRDKPEFAKADEPEHKTVPPPPEKKKPPKPEKKKNSPQPEKANPPRKAPSQTPRSAPPAKSTPLAETGKTSGSSTAQPAGTGDANNKGGAPGAGGESQGGTEGGAKGGSGGGTGSGYIKANYNYIYAHIRKHLVYPQQARRMNMTGRTFYSFVIEKDGRVNSVTVHKSSGFALLDEAGLNAIRAASPLPTPPERAHIVMPIDFRLK